MDEAQGTVAVLRFSNAIYNGSAALEESINPKFHRYLAASCALRRSKRSCASLCYDFLAPRMGADPPADG